MYQKHCQTGRNCIFVTICRVACHTLSNFNFVLHWRFLNKINFILLYEKTELYAWFFLKFRYICQRKPKYYSPKPNKMKKLVLLGAIALPLLFSSCCTLFTSSRQNITFVGQEGIKIYDNGMKIATIGESGETSVSIRKKISSKQLIAKKEGYKPAPLILESTLNPVACINLLNMLAWGIDLGTQKACKYDNTYIEIELEPKEKNNE